MPWAPAADLLSASLISAAPNQFQIDLHFAGLATLSSTPEGDTIMACVVVWDAARPAGPSGTHALTVVRAGGEWTGLIGTFERTSEFTTPFGYPADNVEVAVHEELDASRLVVTIPRADAGVASAASTLDHLAWYCQVQARAAFPLLILYDYAPDASQGSMAFGPTSYTFTDANGTDPSPASSSAPPAPSSAPTSSTSQPPTPEPSVAAHVTTPVPSSTTMETPAPKGTPGHTSGVLATTFLVAVASRRRATR